MQYFLILYKDIKQKLKKQKLAIFLLLAFALTKTCFASSSADFKLEYDSIDTSFSALYGDDFYIDGGMISIQRIGSSADFKIEPIFLTDPAGPTCGNGVIDSGEICDSGNFGGLTCGDFGYPNGNLVCVSCTSIDISSCYTSRSGSSNPAGNPNWIWNNDDDDDDDNETGNEEQEGENQEEENQEPTETPDENEQASEDEEQEEENQEATEEDNENNEEENKKEDQDQVSESEESGEQEKPSELLDEEKIPEKIENKIEKKPSEPEPATAKPEIESEKTIEDKQEEQRENLYPAAEEQKEAQAEQIHFNYNWLFNFEYHLKTYSKWQIIDSIDQTPLLAGELEKNKTYSLSVYDQKNQLIEKKEIKTNEDGDFSYEIENQLEPGRYDVVFVEQVNGKPKFIRQYFLNVKKEKEEDKKINLGTINPDQNWPTINIKASPRNEVFIYIEDKKGLIELFEEKVDNFGLMDFEIPKDLPKGEYKMYIIELTQAGKENYKITKDITYLFEIDDLLHATAPEENSNYLFLYFISFWVLLLFFSYRLIVKNKK